jgi:thiamine transport system permease protein
MKRITPRSSLLPIAYSLPILAVFAFFLLPYGAALISGFAGSSGGELPASLWPVARFTVRQAAFSTIAAVAIGLVGAWFAGMGDSRFSRVLRALTAIPFAMPSILVVLGFVLFFGNSGWLNRWYAGLSGNEESPFHILYQSSAIILAHAFYNFPLVIRLVGDSLGRTRRSYESAAAVLGANRVVAAITVFFPAIVPSLITSALLVFLYSFTSFSIVLVLGGGPASTTLAVEIYRYARILLSFREASIFAIAETAIAALVFAFYVFFEKKARAVAPDSADRPMEKRHSSVWPRLAFAVYLAVIAFLVLGPLLSIMAESFLSRSSRAGAMVPSLRWWLGIGDKGLAALCRSLLLASLSATLACILAILAAFSVKNVEDGSTKARNAKNGGGGQGGNAKSFSSPAMRFFVTSPLASSGIVLGLGFLILYGRNGNLWSLVFVHAVTSLPFAFSSIMGGFNNIGTNIRNAAGTLGAGPFRRLLTVDIPLSAGHIRSAWGFAAAISLGEVSAAMMLGVRDFETLPLLIYRAAGAYRYGTACAAGVLLMSCCAAVFLLCESKVEYNGKRK